MELNLIRAIFLFMTATVAIASCKKENDCCIDNDSNKWPIANAGKDTILVLPLDNIILDGSASYDPDGSITKYQWSGSSSIRNDTAKQTEIVNPGLGIYRFELKVTDNKGSYSRDTVIFQVEASVFPPHPVGFYPFQYSGFSWDTTAMGLMVAGPVPEWEFSDFPESNNGSKWIVELVQQGTNTNIILPYVVYDHRGTTDRSIFYSIKDPVPIFPGENGLGPIYIFAKPNQTTDIDFTKKFDVNLYVLI